MRSFPLLVLIATEFFGLSQSLCGSYGTNFITVFPWNNEERNKSQIVSLDILAPDESIPTEVVIRYTEFVFSGSLLIPNQRTEMYNVTSNKLSVTFSSPVYQYLVSGLNIYPNSRIYVTSQQPISLIAHNYANDGSGDSFTVLPTSMAGRTYSLSFPDPNNADGMAMVYFLAIGNDSFFLSLRILTSTANSFISMEVEGANSSMLTMLGGPQKAFTLYANATVPYLIVTAIRNMNTTFGNDFTSFMPISPPTSYCTTPVIGDHHLSSLVGTSTIAMSPASPLCSPFTVNFTSSKSSTTLNFLADEILPILTVSEVNGTNADIASSTGFMEVIRFGYESAGVFMDTVLSLSQYVTDKSMFVTQKGQNHLTIMADLTTTKTGSLSKIMGSQKFEMQQIKLQWIQLSYFKEYFYATTVLDANSLYSFYSQGKYMVQVVGGYKAHSYGYTPSFNFGSFTPTTSTTVSSTTSTTSTVLSTTTKTTTVPTPAISTTTTVPTLSSSSTSSMSSISSTAVSTTPKTSTTSKSSLTEASNWLFATLLMILNVNAF